MKKIIFLIILFLVGNFLYNKYLKGNDVVSQAGGALEKIELMKSNLSSPVSSVTTTSESDKSMKDPSRGDMLVYFRSLSQNGLSALVEVDAIEMFDGEKAKEAALKDTGCTKEKIVECAPSLNNNFYISNTSTSTEKYTITLSTEVYLVSMKDTRKVEKVSLVQLREKYKAADLVNLRSAPFWITVKDGKILKVEEQYIP